MSGLPATSNQQIAAVSLSSSGSFSNGWTSPEASLLVSQGQLILVRTSFVAGAIASGFSWSIQGTGAVSALESPSDVFSPTPLLPGASIDMPVSRTALFTAVSGGTANFSVNAVPGGTGAKCLISDLVIIARIIADSGAPS